MAMVSNSCLQTLASGAAVVCVNSMLFYLWFVYQFMTNSHMHMKALVSFLMFMAAWSYNKTAFSDPGTPKCDEWREWAAGVTELGPSEVEKNGKGKRGEWAVGRITTCNTCKCLRPERAHHCRRCGVCVLRMDHHCQIIGNCIGWRNHKYFVLTAFWGFVACFAGLSTAQEPDFVTIAKIISAGPAHYGESGYDNLHVRLYTLALILGVSFMIFCVGLFTQDMGMGLLNTNRIEMWYKGSNPYRLPNLLDNLRQIFGTGSLWLLLPLEPDRPSSDGTSFPLGTKAAKEYSSMDRLYAAGWLHVE